MASIGIIRFNDKSVKYESAGACFAANEVKLPADPEMKVFGEQTRLVHLPAACGSIKTSGVGARRRPLRILTQIEKGGPTLLGRERRPWPRHGLIR